MLFRRFRTLCLCALLLASGCSPVGLIVVGVVAAGRGGGGGGKGKPPKVPANVRATAGDAAITVEFDAVSGATSYNLYWLNFAGVTKGSGNPMVGVSSPRPELWLSAARAASSKGLPVFPRGTFPRGCFFRTTPTHS